MRKIHKSFPLKCFHIMAGFCILSLFSPLGICSESQAEQQKETAPILVVCSPEKPTVFPRETINVRAWAVSKNDASLEYTWSVTGGRINGLGPEVRWNFDGVEAGSYAAKVGVRSDRDEETECYLTVIVRKRTEERGRETGWYFLVSGEKEVDGYGLYSYLLFGSRPDQASRERYLKAIEAYLWLIPDILSLEKEGIPRRELNVAYLPIIKGPPKHGLSAEWVLENYNYALARIILRKLEGDYRDGPYILSFLSPPQGSANSLRPFLYQDLSRVPPHIVSSWVKEFLNQAAQQRFWEERKMAKLVLNIRTTVGILALGLPEVQNAIKTWISLIQ
jgi:hypothetical protein